MKIKVTIEAVIYDIDGGPEAIKKKFKEIEEAIETVTYPGANGNFTAFKQERAESKKVLADLKFAPVTAVVEVLE